MYTVRVYRSSLEANHSSIFFVRAGRYVIGRKNCDIPINRKSVSKRHALLHIPGAGEDAKDVRVSDLGSTHGTSVDGVPVEGSAAATVGPDAWVSLHMDTYIRVQPIGSTVRLCLSKGHGAPSTESAARETDRECRRTCQRLGISFTAKWDAGCTHLVIASGRKVASTAKAIAAHMRGAPVVDSGWLAALLEAPCPMAALPDGAPYRPEYVPDAAVLSTLRRSWGDLLAGLNLVVFKRAQELEECARMAGAAVWDYSGDAGAQDLQLEEWRKRQDTGAWAILKGGGPPEERRAAAWEAAGCPVLDKARLAAFLVRMEPLTDTKGRRILPEEPPPDDGAASATDESDDEELLTAPPLGASVPREEGVPGAPQKRRESAETVESAETAERMNRESAETAETAESAETAQKGNGEGAESARKMSGEGAANAQKVNGNSAESAEKWNSGASPNTAAPPQPLKRVQACGAAPEAPGAKRSRRQRLCAAPVGDAGWQARGPASRSEGASASENVDPGDAQPISQGHFEEAPEAAPVAAAAAETVEMPPLRRPAKAAAAAAAADGRPNFKRFRKNAVARCSTVIGVDRLRKMLPKESERELQLRRQQDELDELEEQAEELFNMNADDDRATQRKRRRY